MVEPLKAIEVNTVTLQQLRLGLKADDGKYLTQPAGMTGAAFDQLGATPLVVNDRLPDGVARMVPAVEPEVLPLKPGLFGGHLPVTQELLDDQPPGDWLGDAMRRAMTGATVGGRWLRHSRAKAWQLIHMRLHRRGVTGYPPLPNRHLDRDLQRTWGYRTTIARYLKHHDN